MSDGSSQLSRAQHVMCNETIVISDLANYHVTETWIIIGQSVQTLNQTSLFALEKTSVFILMMFHDGYWQRSYK